MDPSTTFPSPLGGVDTSEILANIQAGLAWLIVLILVILAANSAIAANIAKHARRKGRSFGSFFWIGMLGGFLVSGTIVASIVPAVHMKMRVACPKCDEQLSANASKCPHCGQAMQADSDAGSNVVSEFRNTTRKINLLGIIATSVGTLMMTIAISSLQSDSPQFALMAFAYIVLVVGVTAWATIPARNKTADEIASVVVVN